MEFLWTTLNVSDMERSLQFYQQVLGLPLKGRMSPPDMEIAFLGEGETAVELIQDKLNPAVDLKAPITMGFNVANLDKALAKVKAQGIEIESGPIQAGPHTRFFFFRDPDGMRIQLVEQRGD